jgi:hypothetical protein
LIFLHFFLCEQFQGGDATTASTNGNASGNANGNANDSSTAAGSRARFFAPLDELHPLSAVERAAIESLKKVKVEEKRRLDSLRDLRPLVTDRDSVAGKTEGFFAGLFRAPILAKRVAERVKELLLRDGEEEEGNEEGGGE